MLTFSGEFWAKVAIKAIVDFTILANSICFYSILSKIYPGAAMILDDDSSAISDFVNVGFSVVDSTLGFSKLMILTTDATQFFAAKAIAYFAIGVFIIFLTDVVVILVQLLLSLAQILVQALNRDYMRREREDGSMF